MAKIMYAPHVVEHRPSRDNTNISNPPACGDYIAKQKKGSSRQAQGL
ncbi:hypothetical protein [Pontibacter liquoris]|nr:hypothetical protein [Pontibacter liquoris]